MLAYEVKPLKRQFSAVGALPELLSAQFLESRLFCLYDYHSRIGPPFLLLKSLELLYIVSLSPGSS